MRYVDFNLGDYAQATGHLTFTEDAAYFRLIRKCYETEKPLPVDIAAVQRLVAARTREERKAVETALREYFTLADDGWHQKRCDKEIARFHGKQHKARESANARWSNSERNANALPTQSDGNAPIPHSPPPTSHLPKEREKRASAPDFDTETVPGLDAESWRRWLAYRREIGKPLKPASQREAAEALAAFGADQAAVVKQSVAHGWTGIFALKGVTAGPTAAPRPTRFAQVTKHLNTEGADCDF